MRSPVGPKRQILSVLARAASAAPSSRRLDYAAALRRLRSHLLGRDKLNFVPRHARLPGVWFAAAKTLRIELLACRIPPSAHSMSCETAIGHPWVVAPLERVA